MDEQVLGTEEVKAVSHREMKAAEIEHLRSGAENGGVGFKQYQSVMR